MNKIISKSILLAALVFAVKAQAQEGKAAQKSSENKAAVKTENKNTSTTEKSAAKTATSYSDLLPSSDPQNSAVAEPPSAEAETQKIKNSRWVDQKQLQEMQQSGDIQKSKGENRVKLTANCTDKTGKTFSSNDSGYEFCLQQARENIKNPAAKIDEKDKKGGSGVGTGFQIKFP